MHDCTCHHHELCSKRYKVIIIFILQFNNGSVRQPDREFVLHGAGPFLPEKRKVPHIFDYSDASECRASCEELLFERYTCITEGSTYG